MYILNDYIRKQVILSILTVLAIAAGIETFMELVGQLSDIGVKNYGLLQTLMYVPLQLPADLYQLLPMIGFLGSLIGLGRLANDSELAVMRSSGLSILQISWCVIKAALWIILFAAIIGEWLAPNLQIKADQIKNSALGRSNWLGQQSGEIWLRHDNLFLHVDSVQSPTHIENISLFQFDNNNQLIKTAFSHIGILKNNHWILQNSDETEISQQAALSHHGMQISLDIPLNPKLMIQNKRDVDEDTLWQLVKSIFYRKINGLLTTSFEFSFWQRMVKPLTCIVMICLGVPFVFGSLRSQSNGSRLLIGVSLGFVFYMMNTFFGRITMIYQLPPFLAAILPTLLFASICVVLLWKIR